MQRTKNLKFMKIVFPLKQWQREGFWFLSPLLSLRVTRGESSLPYSNVEWALERDERVMKIERRGRNT
jgi:hypothetical protein